MKASRNRSHSGRGVSLVETLIALLLLTLGLGGVVELFMTQARYVNRSARESRRENLARVYLNQLQAAGHEEIEDQMGVLAKPETPDTAELFGSPTKSTLDPDFRWNARLTREDMEGVKVIQIRVQTIWSPDANPDARPSDSAEKEAVGYVVSP
jgi:type II secretory pathway pseudopilin PulG